MTSSLLSRTLSRLSLPSSGLAHDRAFEIHPCDENLRLRAEYTARLAEFNRVAAQHRLVLHAGIEGPGFRNSWRKFLECCEASRQSWALYREHVAEHRCKRA